jgi:hypothetical protein
MVPCCYFVFFFYGGYGVGFNFNSFVYVFFLPELSELPLLEEAAPEVPASPAANPICARRASFMALDPAWGDSRFNGLGITGAGAGKAPRPPGFACSSHRLALD